MKITMVFPPQWSLTQPYLSLPSLSAYLEQNGYPVEQRDLNIESYDLLLTPGYLKSAYQAVQKKFNRMDAKKYLLPSQLNEYCIHYLALYAGDEVIHGIEDAKKTLRDPEAFFDFQCYSQARKTIQHALFLISAAFFPTVITQTSFEMHTPQFTIEDIIRSSKNKKENPFLSLFLENFTGDLVRGRPDIIGISIIGTSQIIPGLTLARQIKMLSPDTHINIGGSIFTRLLDRLPGWKALFREAVDSIILYEGEKPILELCDCIAGNQPLSRVHNLAYLVNNRVEINEFCRPLKMNELPAPSFDGLPLQKYLAPWPILPILSCRGCYWGKCAFCDHGEIYNQRYDKRDTDSLVHDILTLSKKFNTRYFTFNDEGISPTHLSAIAQRILQRDEKFYFNADIRLESVCTPDLFTMAYRAGFLSFYSGLEAGSDRVLDYMHKGITRKTARDVFQMSSDAGIWNHTFVIFGFPSETEEEADETMNFVMSHKDTIHSVGYSSFVLTRCSRILKNPEKYSISSVCDDENSQLGLSKAYHTTEGLTTEQAASIARQFSRKLKNEYGNWNFWSKIPREHLLLYLSVYKKDRLLQPSTESLTLTFPAGTTKKGRARAVRENIPPTRP